MGYEPQSAVADLFPAELQRHRHGELGNPESNPSFPKAVEVIEFRCKSGSLTLFDQKLYNRLLFQAYPELGQVSQHMAEVVNLRGSHKATDRLDRSLDRLMSTIVKVNYFDRKGSRIPDHYDKMQLLGTSEVRGRKLYYKIEPRLVRALKHPAIYGRINMLVMESFQSKHGLRLYELMIARKHWPTQQDGYIHWKVTVEQLRAMFQCENQYPNVNMLTKRVLNTAVQEINQHTEWTMDYAVHRKGRTVQTIEFTFRNDLHMVGGNEIELDPSAYREIFSDGNMVEDRNLVPYPDTPINREAVRFLVSLPEKMRDKWYEIARMKVIEAEGHDLLGRNGIGLLGTWAPYVVTDLQDSDLIPSAGSLAVD